MYVFMQLLKEESFFFSLYQAKHDSFIMFPHILRLQYFFIFLLWHYPNLPCESSLFSQQLYRLPAELGFKSSETNESCSAWSIRSISALIHGKPFWRETLETRKMIITAAAAVKSQKSIFFSSSRVPEIKFWKFYPPSSPGLHILPLRLKKNPGVTEYQSPFSLSFQYSFVFHSINSTVIHLDIITTVYHFSFLIALVNNNKN